MLYGHDIELRKLREAEGGVGLPVSKRLRYEVLRRDGHRCRYCGAASPEAALTVDHVTPTALGGTDDPANLVTACADCNSGKASSNPDAPLVADVNADAVRWSLAMRQAAAGALLEFESRRRNRELFDQHWQSWGTGSGDNRRDLPRDADWEASVDQITAAGLPVEILLDCIDLAMARVGAQGRRGIALAQVFRYMCGIAWKKLAQIQETARLAVNSDRSGSEPEGTAACVAGNCRYKGAVSDMLGLATAAITFPQMTPNDYDWYIAQAETHDYGLGIEGSAAYAACWDAGRALKSLGDLLAILPDGAEWLHQADGQLRARSGTFSNARRLAAAAELGAAASTRTLTGEPA